MPAIGRKQPVILIKFIGIEWPLSAITDIQILVSNN